MDLIETKEFDQLSPEEKIQVAAICDEKSYKQMRQLYLELSEHKIEFEDKSQNLLFIETPSKSNRFILPLSLWKVAAVIAIACNLVYAYLYHSQGTPLSANESVIEQKTNIRYIRDTVIKIVIETPITSYEENTVQPTSRPQHFHQNKKSTSNTKTGSSENASVGIAETGELNTLSFSDFKSMNTSSSGKSLANDSFIRHFSFVTFN